jgi:hypothetical protein
MIRIREKIRINASIIVIAVLITVSIVSCFKDTPQLPDSLIWNPEVAFPLGEDSFGLNEVSGFDTSLLDLDTITQIPKWALELQIVMEGDMEFSLTPIQNNMDQLNRLLLRVNIHNGFPNPVLAQAYFRDASQITLDSLFNDGALLVPAGTVQQGGQTIEPAFARKDAIFDRNRLEAMENATEVYFRAIVSLADLDSSLISFYPQYQFDVRIGAMLDLSLEF